MSLLPKIQALLRAMDDDALAALANRGLLRRAKKDAETITPEILEETGKYVRLRVDDCDVTIPEVPAEARSNSPAGNIDRYVLIAFLWLKNRPEIDDGDSLGAAKTQAVMFPEFIGDAELTAWAGKAAFRKTEKLLDGNVRCVVESEQPLVIRIPERNVVCRWIDGGSLETMVVTGAGKNPKEDGLLALMLYQIEKGVRSHSLPSADPIEISAGAPRTRLEVLSSLGDVLHEMIVLGLTRLSEATRQRLQTLAVSAHGVDLPRLERMIQGLADEIRLQTSRNAQASTSRILAQAARLDALRRALLQRIQGKDVSSAQTPFSDLVGEHRSRYHSVGSIDLVGMGARQWRTKSGYSGLTVYFWDDSCKNWATWSESRPVTVPDFDPVSVFHGEGPWNGCPGPAFASRNILKLTDAFRNDNGRLSVRQATQAIPLQIDDTDAMIQPPPIVDWTVLYRQAGRLFHGGLAKRNERDEIVFLKPGGWDDPVFDPTEQVLYRTIFDENDRPVPLVLTFDPEFGGQQAIHRLENYDTTGNRGVLGLIRLHRGTIAVEPVSLFDSDGIHHLTLENQEAAKRRAARSKKSPDSGKDPEIEPAEEEHEWYDLAPNAGPVDLLLEAMLSDLEMLAESGLAGSASNRNNSLLEQHLNQSKRIGLESVSKILDHFLDILRKNDRLSQETHDIELELSSALLHGYHVILVAMQSLRFMNADPAG